MANQIVVSAGAKVRNLDGVLTGTSGVVNSLPINASNGIPQLDVNGKILVSQLPNSVMEYQGTWNANTNTPTLTNGGAFNQGDVYLCNVAGTTNFGAGPISFIVGDQAIYSGTIWQKAGGATGTVTSVGITESGDSLNITGSPITTSGTINIGFNGTNLQYVNGAGNLTTFPTLITSIGLSMPSAFSVANSPLTANGTIAVTGAGTTAQYIRGDGSLATFPAIATEAQRLITEVYNETGATLTKGTVVYINGGHGNLPTITKAIATGDATSAQTYGIVQTDITNNNNGYVVVIGSLTDLDTQAYVEGTQLYLSSTTAGAWTSTKQYAPAHLVYVAIVTRSHPTQGVVEVRIQNGFEMDELHNVSAQSPLNNQGLFYNTSTSLWENKSIATALGYTPANDALVVHNTGNETIGGTKTFSDATKNNGGIFLQNASSSSLAGYMNIGGLTNGVKFTSGGGVSNTFTLPSATGYTFTFPNATGTLALTSDISYPVTSVFGRTGAVVATSGDYTTAQVTESGNLYYTDSRARLALGAGAGISYNSTTGVITSTITQYTDALARLAISLTTTGTSGAATYNSTTGVLNIPQYIGGVTSVFGRTGAVVATEGDYSLTQLSDVTIISPTTNQVLKYNGTTWVNDTDANTGTVTSVGLSAPTGFSVTGSPVTTSGTLALAFASGYSLPTTVKQSNWDDAYTFVAAFPTQTGNSGKYLTTDGSVLSWATNPLGTVTSVGLSSATSGVTIGSSPITTSGTITLAIATATTSQNGLLSSTDWTTFNSKQAELNGTGFVKASGTTISYDNSTYLTTTSAALTYLQLTGGSLTGNLEILNGNNFYLYNTGSSTYWWQRNNANTYELKYGASSTPLTISNAGAATFLSSVTATSFVKTSGTSSQILAADGSVITAGTNITISGGTISSSGGGGGSISLAAIGSTPNANAATLTGSVLNLEPASASFGGVVTTGLQTFAGNKNFNGQVNIGTTTTSTYGNVFIKVGTNQNFVFRSSTSIARIETVNDAVSTQVPMEFTATRYSFSGASGFVGINTTTPGSYLQVNGGAAIGYSASTAAPTNGLLVAGRVGINATIASWAAAFSTLQLGTRTVLWNADANQSSYGNNIYYDGGAYRYVATAGASYHEQFNGSHNWYYAPSGTAGAAFTPTLGMTMSNTGTLGINTSTVGSRVQINGNAAIGYSASTAAPSNGLQVSGSVFIGTSDDGGKLVSYSTTAASQIKAAGTAPAITFSNTVLSPTIGGVLGVCTAASQFFTGTASSDMVLANQFSAGDLIFGTNNLARMRVKASGVINITSIPTTSVGLVAGDIYSNAGILTIV